jgi:hypothetical protein
MKPIPMDTDAGCPGKLQDSPWHSLD